MHDRATGASAKRGAEAERQVGEFLTARGLTLLCCNYRTQAGEIDLVMRNNTHVVFIEVKLRQSPSFGGAAASVTAAKQRRIARAAASYLQQNSIALGCRFDVVEVRQLSAQRWQFNWIKNAFFTPSDAFEQ